MKKYIVYGGDVTNGQQTHYVSAHQVMRLYGLALENCILVDWDSPSSFLGFVTKDHVKLGPRSDGNYVLPDSGSAT